VSGPPETIDAGPFATWLVATDAAISAQEETQVPCGGCTACCTSSQFVYVGPGELDTIAHIPAALLFPAPGLPAGHYVLGYDEEGRCPMLVDGGCSIYEHRPRACRVYDCRVMAAAGVEPDLPEQEDLAARVRQWSFGHPSATDRVLHEAVRAAARYLGAHHHQLPVPPNAPQLAALAVEVHRCFVDDEGPRLVEPDVQAVLVELSRRRPAEMTPIRRRRGARRGRT